MVGSRNLVSGPSVLDKFGRGLDVYADFTRADANFGVFKSFTPHGPEDKLQRNVIYDYNNRVLSSESWTAESGTSAGQWITTEMEYGWNADLGGTTLYYEKTQVLSNATGLSNTTPNIVNATYTDSRGRKVGTITYGATTADDIVTRFS